MKFKVYVWNTIFRQPDYFDIDFDFLPSISLNVSFHNFEPDEDFDYWRKGKNCFLMFSWLFWGITFDLRTGIDTGGKKK